MGILKLFRFDEHGSEELEPWFANQETSLHDLVERNLGTLFGIRFLAREYPTGKAHRGQIDTLAIDEENCPVIIEYKKRNNENIITQALFYLDWLMDHQSEFRNLAQNILGEHLDGEINFLNTRLICLASDFNKYDEKAINQIDRHIELIRYKLYASDLLLLEQLNTAFSPFIQEQALECGSGNGIGMPLPFQSRVKGMNENMERLYLDTLDFAEGLGDDVTVRFLKHYVAVSRSKNFTCIQPKRNYLKLWLNLDPDEIVLEAGFSRDVSSIGHHASGNLELDIRGKTDLEKAKPLIALAYKRN